MADYIKREDVLRITRPDDWRTPDERWRPESEFGMFVENLPAADVVEVVRCKDCKHATMTYDGLCKYCEINFPEEAAYYEGDFYCAFGERSDEEDG